MYPTTRSDDANSHRHNRHNRRNINNINNIINNNNIAVSAAVQVHDRIMVCLKLPTLNPHVIIIIQLTHRAHFCSNYADAVYHKIVN